jgi:uncharacterized protein YbcC (UPF0753/DUF2309 family)
MALKDHAAADPSPGGGADAKLIRLEHAIDHAAHLLPAQGPITVFIHHNTLHAFEDLPFTEAVRKAARVFDCAPYLQIDRYRAALNRGRIRFDDLRAVLREGLGPRADEPVLTFGTRLELRLAMLEYPLRSGPPAELRWFIAETDALRRIREDASEAVRVRLVSETRRWAMRDLRSGARVHGLRDLIEQLSGSEVEEWGDDEWEAFTLQVLWRVCRAGVRQVPPTAPPPSSAVRPRDLLLRATGQDADISVNDLLIRFCAAFLDQGFAHWVLPRRDDGFYRAFCELYRQPYAPPDRWLRGLPAELSRLADGQVTPLESVAESLDLLGVAESEWDDVLSATLLALRGWGGMVRQVEVRGDRVPHPVPKGSLVEFLAIRLVLDRLSAAHTAQESLGYTGPLAGLRAAARAQIVPPLPPGVEQRAFAVFQLAQVLGWCPEELHRLLEAEWAVLLAEIEAVSGIERRQTFHLAYERRFRDQSLDVLALHERRSASMPRFQAVFCLDEREESFRRHLEEVAPDVETFAAAGFYGVAMYYRGAADAHFVPLCPIVVQPTHWVAEQVVDRDEDYERQAWLRRVLGTLFHRVHTGTRTVAGGAVLTAAFGVLASAPLIARVLFPRWTARLRKRIAGFLQPQAATRLTLLRQEPMPGPDGGRLGFAVDEMAALAERQLRDIGLTRNFARLVFILGHGSDSQNNPHKSAYDCGACGGSPGAPNGRALAQILNKPVVRERLTQRGLPIPEDTHFVGGFHNTCDDSVTLFDLDRLPESHKAEFQAARRDLKETSDRNAHERSRRFMSAPLTLPADAARHHVEGRSEDLAQTRPELGHATNALCVVGRRARTRGLFLDRRAFLTSYDPTQDDADATILTRILQAAVPVCAGINLEYYFSHVDCPGYGCGTKLPHNITSQLGVMDGAASDLRTGLPWQMVEIHEPVRLLFVIETTAETMLRIMDREPTIGRLVRNGWVQLAVLHPDHGRVRVFHHGSFWDYRPQTQRLPRAAASVDWYRGWRDHLEFAEIGPMTASVSIEDSRLARGPFEDSRLIGGPIIGTDG